MGTEFYHAAISAICDPSFFRDPRVAVDHHHGLVWGVMLTPPDPQAWQTLGDALVRAVRLERANQSYEQARELRQ